MDEIARLLDKHYVIAAAAARGKGPLWEHTNEAMHVRLIAQRYEKSVGQLVSWNVIRKSNTNTARLFASYFEVPKKDNLNRAILN